jgi:hypothetical protein
MDHVLAELEEDYEDVELLPDATASVVARREADDQILAAALAEPAEAVEAAVARAVRGEAGAP